LKPDVCFGTIVFYSTAGYLKKNNQGTQEITMMKEYIMINTKMLIITLVMVLLIVTLASGCTTTDKSNESSPVIDDNSSSGDTIKMVMEGIDVPNPVLIAAKNQVAVYYDMNCADFANYEYTAWRIDKLELAYTYGEMEGMTLDIYRMNYEYLTEAPENIVFAGGMYITEDNWVCPTYPDCTYLVFNADSDSFLFAMMENDCYPGDETFTADLRRIQSSAQTDATEFLSL